KVKRLRLAIDQQTFCLYAIELDAFYSTVETKRDAKRGRKFNHSFDNLMHATLWIAGAATHICVVHHSIYCGCVFWCGAKKQHREFKELNQPLVMEELFHIRSDRLKYVEFEHSLNQAQIHQFRQRNTGLIHQFTNANIVFVFSLLQKFS